MPVDAVQAALCASDLANFLAMRIDDLKVTSPYQHGVAFGIKSAKQH
jgi:hypothetical protein